ncbi:serine hydrolase domain-containing protein [Gammaproteobacteria bacterium AB-CW1]|uniref:Serine hydrolase domain-containing protein n=1 Tax=Natronospira elongata TaxID=3110268 RepID=A0AAP6MKD6_9GAMM|nr:serine hydrolase domain-containing protein [Gammaproteobacteria bacterium AB-CW1]
MWWRERGWVKGLWILLLLASLALGGVTACLDSGSNGDDDSGNGADNGNGEDNGDGDDGNGDDGDDDDPEGFDALIQAYLQEKFSQHAADPCFAVGVVTPEAIEIGTACTNEATGQAVDANSRFQIGSITKPMLGIVTQAVMAQQDQPVDTLVEDWLRPDAQMPDNQGVAINLAHVLTHTSGLARFPVPPLPVNDWDDPYKDISPEALIDTLSDEDNILENPVGEYGYSNYATMLLTVAATDRSDTDFGDLLDQVIFGPAGMSSASLSGDLIQGHTDDGNPTVPWQFHENVAGLGGVRASVSDMLAFIDTNLGAADDPDLAALWEAQQSLVDFGNFRVGSLWNLADSWYEDGETLVFHDGVVGGFTSFLIFERQGDRGVVVLADTFGIDAAEGIGDEVSELAAILLDPEEELEEPTAAPLSEAGMARVAAREAFLDTARQLRARRVPSPEAANTAPQLQASWPLNGTRLEHFPDRIQLSASSSLDASRLHAGQIQLERIHPDGRVEAMKLDQQAIRLEPLDQHAHSFRLILPRDLQGETGHFRLRLRHDGLATDLAGRPLDDFSLRFTVGEVARD